MVRVTEGKKKGNPPGWHHGWHRGWHQISKLLKGNCGGGFEPPTFGLSGQERSRNRTTPTHKTQQRRVFQQFRYRMVLAYFGWCSSTKATQPIFTEFTFSGLNATSLAQYPRAHPALLLQPNALQPNVRISWDVRSRYLGKASMSGQLKASFGCNVNVAVLAARIGLSH